MEWIAIHWIPLLSNPLEWIGMDSIGLVSNPFIASGAPAVGGGLQSERARSVRRACANPASGEVLAALRRPLKRI